MVDREPDTAGEPESVDERPGHGLFDGPRHETVSSAPRSRRLGVVMFVAAVVLLALDGVALALLAADAVTGAATFALITLLASVIVGVIALVAVAMRRGRGWGVAAVLLSVLANPFVLVWVIGRFVVSV